MKGKKKEAKKPVAKKPAAEVKKPCKFVRQADAPNECKSIKNKQGSLFFIDPYTNNRNKNDMLRIHRNMGAKAGSMMHYVAECINNKMDIDAILKGLERFVGVTEGDKDTPSVKLSKSRYRLKKDGRETVEIANNRLAFLAAIKPSEIVK